jgi:FAD/FMN-containing dehydrogenase
MTVTKKTKYMENIDKNEVYQHLVGIFGENYVSMKQVDLYPYSYDMTEAERSMPDFVVMPESNDQLIDLVKFCNT